MKIADNKKICRFLKKDKFHFNAQDWHTVHDGGWLNTRFSLVILARG